MKILEWNLRCPSFSSKMSDHWYHKRSPMFMIFANSSSTYCELEYPSLYQPKPQVSHRALFGFSNKCKPEGKRVGVGFEIMHFCGGSRQRLHHSSSNTLRSSRHQTVLVLEIEHLRRESFNLKGALWIRQERMKSEEKTRATVYGKHARNTELLWYLNLHNVKREVQRLTRSGLSLFGTRYWI